MSVVKNDYETFANFVNQYPAYLELAKRLGTNPGSLLKVIGQEVLKKSVNKMIPELAKKIKTETVKRFELSADSLKYLDDLLTWLKSNESKKYDS
jgi:hypothetical protein